MIRKIICTVLVSFVVCSVSVSECYGAAEDTHSIYRDNSSQVMHCRNFMECFSETLMGNSTSVSGIDTDIVRKADSDIIDQVTVEPAYGRKLELQMYEQGRWVTKQTVKLGNGRKETINLKYPYEWKKTEYTKWRIYIAGSRYGREYSSIPVRITARRYYQNPPQYIQISNSIVKRDSGGYDLSYGYMGLKVKAVNNYFGIGDSHWPRYDDDTEQHVREFQREKGIEPSGKVDKKTWLRMGFSEKDWYNLGSYVTPVKSDLSSTRDQLVEIMISTAMSYRNAPYVVGASGNTSQGTDCSGLVMQALYSAGVDPYPVSVVRHSKPGYEYESRNLFKSSRFRKIPYEDRKRGDIIFFESDEGVIIHVGIYLGNDKMVHSWPDKVMVSPVDTGEWGGIAGVRRVFN